MIACASSYDTGTNPLIRKGHMMSTSIAIVAGAGSGFGQSTALALHSAGLTVVAVDRSEAWLPQLPSDVPPGGRRRHRSRGTVAPCGPDRR